MKYILSLILSVLFITPVFAVKPVISEYTEKKQEQKQELTQYEKEIKAVIESKLATKDLDKPVNKCEVLQMFARKFNWQISAEQEDPIFSDTPDWCQNLANHAHKLGIVKGRSSTLLGLDTPTTRYEVAVILFRILQLLEYEFSITDGEHAITDEITEWARSAVITLVRNGIIKGFHDKTFKGENPILKQDLGIILLRLKKLDKLNDKILQNTEKPEVSDSIKGVYELQNLNDTPIYNYILKLDGFGRFNIEGDCNKIFGNYVIESNNDNFKIQNSIMTKMHCEKSDEAKLIEALNKINKYKLEETSLTLHAPEENLSLNWQLIEPETTTPTE